MIYKTLNNHVCHEIVTNALSGNKVCEEVAVTLLVNWHMHMTDELLKKLWFIVGKFLIPVINRDRLRTCVYFQFKDYIEPRLKKGGVIM